ncbi:uncharacterized protein LOC115787369 [Archocentrus centrarchus]|uniref:uncharacterized protein LOC115787369 n=1 Tax=Archocentrus centrarchus TaxID=63155 RepID=UPI0011E9E851|nr:uncharacterized protein LOC115787369 [Archocentrus centrarchus]
MSCKQKRRISILLFVASAYFYMFQLCCSVSLGQWEDGFAAHRASAERERIKQDEEQVGQVIGGPDQRESNDPGLHQPQPGSQDSHPPVSAPELNKSGFNSESKSFSWITGNVNVESKSSAPESVHGYQADFTGFQGKVLGLSSSPHVSEWQAMRPLVECDHDAMIFTASSQGFTHLLVDRGGASPISVFQLPPYCGYSVRTSWSGLEMMVPYEACYITQENGSYILPLLWWGSPLKLSCPIQTSTPTPSFPPPLPSVFCSSYGMAVQIHAQEKDIPQLGVKVNGALHQFVSEQCAYYVDSQSQDLTFFIYSSAPCFTSGDGLQLELVLDDNEYILSCPVSPQFPYAPSTPWSPPLSPGNPQFPYIPDPVRPAATSAPLPTPSPPPTQEQIAKFPEYPHYNYPGLQFPQLPQLYPPGPQAKEPPQPTGDSPPGPQPDILGHQQFLYPGEPGNLPYSLGIPWKYPPFHYQSPVTTLARPDPNLGPAQDRSPHQVPKLPPQYPFGVHYPHMSFYYPAVTPAPTPPPQTTTTTTTTTVLPATTPAKPPSYAFYPQYYLQMPYYPEPANQPPAPLPPVPPPPPSPQSKQPVGYPAASYDSYYGYWPVSYPKPSALHPAAAPPLGPAKTTTDSPGFFSSLFNFHRPIYSQPAASPTPQKPVVPQDICLPYSHTICSYYSYPYYLYHTLYPPHYIPPYPPLPQYPEIQPPVTTPKPSTSTTTATPPTTSSTTQAWRSPQTLNLQCMTGRMVVFLPFTHPDSIQVRDRTDRWLFLSSVSPLCGYMLQMTEGFGVILHSPLPACHSQLQTPTAISLPIRFWDLSMAQYRTLDLQCPFQSTSDNPATVTSLTTPTPPSTTKDRISPSVTSRTKVFCSSHQMTVALPSGPISEIVVKDIKGNQKNLKDVPKHCGYSASKGKDGKIHLNLQLHSRCHMSVQDKLYIITVIYMTVNGKRESQFSCPVAIPGPRQECNLPREQHLPCGSSALSQTQCLSIGCCFNKHPPACYYPMDECTIDRHFVFSVPASITEPPLSPALLVAASNSTCKPQKVTSDYALFKIPMDGCGTRRVMLGKTVVYMVEVINMVKTISLNYGTITRDSPVRLLVECRYMPGTVLTVSYMVKTPTLGPEIQSHGAFGVQLRIAEDDQYKSYYPQYHQPLKMMLGKPLNLEVRLLNSPDPTLVLLVHFCVAYPRSGKAVWVLLYNGCPNPLDPVPPQAILSHPQPLSPDAQTRRFTIRTFQFLPDGEFKDPNEEIYFMCSTEICSPRDGPCVEGCFGQ